MGIVLIIMAMVFVLGPLAKAYADRLSRGLPADAEAQRLELARLREEVDRLSVEMARLQEEQSFMLKLLNAGDRTKLLQNPTDDQS
jgi:hypothetical protein